MKRLVMITVFFGLFGGNLLNAGIELPQRCASMWKPLAQQELEKAEKYKRKSRKHKHYICRHFETLETLSKCVEHGFEYSTSYYVENIKNCDQLLKQ